MFPPDSSEVELYAHFRRKLTGVELLYPQVYLDEDLVQGDFYAVRLAHVPPGTFRLDEKTIYRGLFIQGQNRSGVFTTCIISDWHSFLPDSIRTQGDLETKRPVIDQEVKKGHLLHGYWFHVANEPTPFESVIELVNLVGNGDVNRGYQRLNQLIGEQIKLLPPYVDIGVRYLNRRGDLEWQLFRLLKNAENAHTLLGELTPDLLGQMIKRSYDQVSAVHSELLSDTTFHQRNQGRADRSSLLDKHLIVIGCGSIGSEIADAVGKGGVGTVSLIDKEVFNAHNAVRHVGGLDRLGQAKVELMAEHLMLHNPFISIKQGCLNILSFPINQYIETGAIGISTIADDNVEGYLNEQAIVNRHTLFYARALRGGKAARIFRVVPGHDACFYCLSLYAAHSDPRFVTIPEDPALPTLVNECNNPVRPASAADLKLIGALTSRLLLDHLQGRLASGENHWIWSTEPDVLEGVQPFTLQRGWLPPNPTCPYCTLNHPYTLSLPTSILATMRQETELVRELETGGVLVGIDNGKGKIIVEAVSGPGPKALKQPTRFEKDIDFCQRFIDDAYEGEGWVYVGEWHYHPKGSNKPSAQDLDSLNRIAQQKEYMTATPIMAILDNSGQASYTIHPAGSIYYFATPQILPN